MARGIIDCTGQVINCGDRVRTEDGTVIEVIGGFVSSKKLYNAEKCVVVPKSTPTTAEKFAELKLTAAAEGQKLGVEMVSGADDDINDCVVWGT
jgi:hypothetical protein